MNGSGESLARGATPAAVPSRAAVGLHATPAEAAAAAPSSPTSGAASQGAATATNPVTAAVAALPLVQLLQQTLSADPAVLRVAQEALDAKATAEDFPKELLLLLVNPDTPPAAKQAGAIYFKNFVRRNWDVDPQQGGISLANRTLIKQHLLSLLLAPAAAKIVQLQLADACTRIATTDMPLDWPSLLPELMQQHLVPGLATQQQLLQQQLQQRQQYGGVLQQDDAFEQQLQIQLQKEVAVLGMLHAVLKKYRTAFRSNEVLLELREVLPSVQQPLLQAFMLALQLLQTLQSASDGARTVVAASGVGGTTTATTAAAAGSSSTTTDPLRDSTRSNQQATRELVCEVLLLCCKTFFSLNTVDIPEFFEDHMQEYFGGFIRLLRVDLLPHSVQQHSSQQHDNEEDDVASVEDKLRTQICLNMKLYADKYQEEFQGFVMACVQAVWQMMTCIDRRRRFDFTAAAAMEFLSSAASTAWQLDGEAGAPPAGNGATATGDPFSNVQLLQEICEKTILPNVQLRDCDVEQMEDTPLEFARRELEGGEQHTRRSAALDLIKSLMKFREELITALLLQAVQALSSQAAAKAAAAAAAASGEGAAAVTAGGAAACDAAGGGVGGATRAAGRTSTATAEEEEERLLDACTFLVLAVGVKGSTRIRGVHAVNKNVDTQQFFQSLLLKELQNPDVNKRFIVRIGAMKVVAAFRNVFDAQLLQGVLPLLVMHLSAKRVVVHTFAAYALERLLSAGQGGQPRIDKVTASSGLKQALAVLLQQLQTSSSANAACGAGGSGIGRGGAENEFLVKCTLRIFSFLKDDAADAVLPALRVVLDSIKKVANNPSNPSFSHYLFECLATLVKLSCSRGGNSSNRDMAGTVNKKDNSTRAAVEREVIPVLSVLVQQTVHEFVPYCFQILGLLLETAAAEEEGIPPAAAALYVELYGHLLAPSFWTAAQGNVPALVKLLCCYFHRQQLFPDMIKNSIQQLLQRFQYCLYHKKLSSAAFELLNSVFRLLPFSFYASCFRMLLTVLLRRVHELNKRLSICKEVSLSLMLFQRDYGEAFLPEEFCQCVYTETVRAQCKCEDPAMLVNTLEAIQTGLWQQVLSFILLPAIAASGAAPLHHKKVLILGLSRVTTCPAVATNKALLSPTLEALAALIARKEEDERDVHRTRASLKHAALEEDESIGGYDPLSAAEFDLCYARLAAADIHHTKDMVENVTDIQRSVQMCLSPLKADIEELARGGAQVRPLLAVLLAV